MLIAKSASRDIAKRRWLFYTRIAKWKGTPKFLGDLSLGAVDLDDEIIGAGKLAGYRSTCFVAKRSDVQVLAFRKQGRQAEYDHADGFALVGPDRGIRWRERIPAARRCNTSRGLT